MNKWLYKAAFNIVFVISKENFTWADFLHIVVCQSVKEWNTSVVNFINFLQAAFTQIFFRQKKSKAKAFFYLHITKEKLPKRLLYEIGVRKMLMKLTPARSYDFFIGGGKQAVWQSIPVKEILEIQAALDIRGLENWGKTETREG